MLHLYPDGYSSYFISLQAICLIGIVQVSLLIIKYQSISFVVVILSWSLWLLLLWLWLWLWLFNSCALCERVVILWPWRAVCCHVSYLVLSVARRQNDKWLWYVNGGSYILLIAFQFAIIHCAHVGWEWELGFWKGGCGFSVGHINQYIQITIPNSS